jgi:hypothetical protein
VDTGVSAAGALGQDYFAGQVFENGHQRSLDGWAVRLDLPSGEVVAVITQRELEIARQKSAPEITSVRKRTVACPGLILTLFNARKHG